MLGDKAYDSAELREQLHERGTKPVIPKPQQPEATDQLQQASLQAALAHRECLQQVEGLQAHRNPLRQTRTKLSGLCLPDRRSCMVDLMSLDLVICCTRSTPAHSRGRGNPVEMRG
jgi:hypothetical protein